jgi:phenylacetate-CoA ligase
MAMLLRFRDATIDVSDLQLDYEDRAQQMFAVAHAFLEDTYESCSYHRQRMQRVGVTPAHVKSFDDFRMIPMMGPEDVQSTSEFSLLPDRYGELYRTSRGAELPPELRLWRRFTSTGSTGGRPKASFYSAVDWDVTKATLVRYFSHVPFEHWSRAFNCFHSGHIGGKITEDSLMGRGVFVENRHFLTMNDEGALRQLCGGIPELGGFNAMSTPPCLPPEMNLKKGITLDDLLKIDADNYIGKNLRVLWIGGYASDLPETRLRERVWEANELAGAPRTQFIEVYGSAEIFTTATSCQYDDGLHLCQGNVHIEVIDEKTGLPVKEGERGLVTITGLRHGTRYLRYVVGDEATYLGRGCRCGRTSPRIKTVRRVLDKGRLKSGCSAGGIA